MRAEVFEIVFASDQIPLGIPSAPSRLLSRPLFLWVRFLSLRPAHPPRENSRVARRRRVRRPRTGRISRRWRDSEGAQENICGAIIDPRKLFGPTLAAGNKHICGAWWAAMLPADISRSGLKTLLLHGSCRRRSTANWADLAESMRYYLKIFQYMG